MLTDKSQALLTHFGFHLFEVKNSLTKNVFRISLATVIIFSSFRILIKNESRLGKIQRFSFHI